MRNQSGQSLFELVVAVGLIGVVLIALVGLSTKSLSNATYSKNNTLATRHTQEALEWLRGLRDQDWATFIAYDNAASGGTYWCLSSLANPLPESTRRRCGEQEYVPGTKFIREAYVDYLVGPPETVEVGVITSWADSAGTHQANSQTTFTNWRKQ